MKVKFSKSEEKVKWCWTKSMVNEPSFKLDQKNGGMNWSFCTPPKKDEVVNFSIIVDTSSLPKSATKYN